MEGNVPCERDGSGAGCKILRWGGGMKPREQPLSSEFAVDAQSPIRLLAPTWPGLAPNGRPQSMSLSDSSTSFPPFSGNLGEFSALKGVCGAVQGTLLQQSRETVPY